jgi:3-deoxy-7-phosphoheptulonate synthase/chorismate mutase
VNDPTSRSAVLQVRPPELRVQALQALRLQIDEQDLSILQAIEQRGRIVEEILVLKQSAGFPAFDAIRERQLLERLHTLYRGPYQWQDVEQFFRKLLEMSRTLPVPTRKL